MRRALLLLLLTVTVCTARDRGVPATEGITNFGKVNAILYRGAQPDVAGLKRLAQLGIKSIINLRMTNELWQAEAVEACASGMVYTNVPLKGLGRPTDAQIAMLLDLIETLPGPVFVHCRHGCDRTGTIIACYRIRRDRWSTEAALSEARKYGLSALERGMIACIRDFGKAAARN